MIKLFFYKGPLKQLETPRHYIFIEIGNFKALHFS